jgi:PDZ domain-containing protein
MLIEGNNNALTVALDEAKISYEKTNIVHEITYLTNESKTNLQVGDQIILVDNQKIDNLSSLIEHINTLEVGDKVNILVKRNDQEKNLTAEVYLFKERKMIGVMLSTLFDLKLDFKLELKTENRESGGSGGLMTALAVYNNLTQKDLTNGRKIVGTGTIDAAGNVGLIGGVKYKLIGAVKNNADLFIVPKNNLKEALEYKKKYNYKIEIIGVNTFKEAVELLNVS